MPAKYIRPTVSAAPPIPPLLIPQPPIAPLVPPAHVVDLMTAGIGARWKANEAKIVECPALTDSMPEFRTTYDIEPHAEITGFDDADSPACRGQRARQTKTITAFVVMLLKENVVMRTYDSSPLFRSTQSVAKALKKMSIGLRSRPPELGLRIRRRRFSMPRMTSAAGQVSGSPREMAFVRISQ
jgi:hypothetical protein